MSDSNGSVAERDGRGTKLPRGRHGIPPEQVIANQRQRMLAATAALFAERGYSGFSVGDVTTGAQVSRATFYKLFDDKADCVCATHGAAFEQLEEALLAACFSRASWPESVAAAVAAALQFAAEEPAAASLIAFAPLAGDSDLTGQAQAASKRLLAMLRAGRERCPDASVPSDFVERALLLGTVNVIGAELLAGRTERLAELAPELTEILLAPYLGAGQARLVASTA